jgi:hypothetical protein
MTLMTRYTALISRGQLSNRDWTFSTIVQQPILQLLILALTAIKEVEPQVYFRSRVGETFHNQETYSQRIFQGQLQQLMGNT